VIRCRQVPCYGTGSHDLIYERKGNGKRDRIFLKGRRNQVRAERYTRDKIWGGKGNNKCYVDARSEVGGGCSRVRVR
jgi:hypothetical protein